MLLPHGYEGQGPEHSSARIERFLQLSADNNIQVCNPTTTAQYFHLLRRQTKRDFRKPLVIMTPKSLLRAPEAMSREHELTSGHFHDILDDQVDDRGSIRRMIFCSGKIYYELKRYRDENDIRDTAIIRIEQLYPFNEELIEKVFGQYPKVERTVWCQEEPQNMGAWSQVGLQLSMLLNVEIHYAGRDASASPAGGSLARHNRRQKLLVEQAYTI